MKLILDPATTARPATVDANVTEAGGGTRYNIRLDGATVATARATKAGTLSVGVAISASAALGAHTVQVRDSSNKVTLASATLSVADVIVVPPPVWPYATLQAAIDATPSGGTLVLPSGRVFAESARITKPMTLDCNGAAIDGTGRPYWIEVAASDVTILNPICRTATTPVQNGALRFLPGTARGKVSGGDLSGSFGAAIAFGNANQTIVENVNIHDNGQLGVHLGGDGVHGIGNVLRNCHVHHNNAPLDGTWNGIAHGANDPEWEAGGVKATRQTNLTFDSNEVDHNGGPGLWMDIYGQATQYLGNRCHDNTHAGIMEEVSYNGIIRGNACWKNGFGKAVWAWGCGILISSSTGTIAENNVTAWNARGGVAVLSQNRQDWPGVKPISNIKVRNNVDAMLDNVYSNAWLEDFAGGMFDLARGNTGSGNRYWNAIPEDSRWRFAYGSSYGKLADFNATYGEEGGTYLTDAQKDAVLTAAGIPVAP